MATGQRVPDSESALSCTTAMPPGSRHCTSCNVRTGEAESSSGAPAAGVPWVRNTAHVRRRTIQVLVEQRDEPGRIAVPGSSQHYMCDDCCFEFGSLTSRSRLTVTIDVDQLDNVQDLRRVHLLRMMALGRIARLAHSRLISAREALPPEAGDDATAATGDLGSDDVAASDDFHVETTEESMSGPPEPTGNGDNARSGLPRPTIAAVAPTFHAVDCVGYGSGPQPATRTRSPKASCLVQ